TVSHTAAPRDQRWPLIHYPVVDPSGLVVAGLALSEQLSSERVAKPARSVVERWAGGHGAPPESGAARFLRSGRKLRADTPRRNRSLARDQSCQAEDEPVVWNVQNVQFP